MALVLVSATFAACTAGSDLPAEGGHALTLVRLEGEPNHEYAPTRMRVLVAELGMGVDPAGSPAEFDADRINEFAQHASVYQPDLLIALDAPFGGPFLGDANPSEDLAVATDRFYRVEARTNIPRRRTSSVPVSPASGGTLVLSEHPLRVTTFDTPTARPLAPFYFAPFVAEISLDTLDGPIRLLVRDGLSPDATNDAVQVSRGRGGDCNGLQTVGQFPICLAAPDSWELLRHEVVADFAGLGLRAIKAEFRLSASAPVATE